MDELLLRPSPKSPGRPAWASHLDALHDTARLRPAAFELEITPFEAYQKDLASAVLPSYRDLAAFLGERSYTNMMVSANIVDALKKQVFDACYAALDLAIEEEKTAHVSRAELFRRLADRLDGNPLLAGAGLLAEGKDDPANPMLKAFLADPMRSKPIGFYTWDESLGRIFRRDRFLQEKFDLPSEAFDRARAAVTSDAALDQAYRFHAEFLRLMTNPFTAGSPAGDPAKFEKWAFLPPCRSNEAELVKENPRLTDPMDELIRRVRDGRMTLAPREDSGFYDYEQHALKVYLLAQKYTEGRKVNFGELYLQRLEDLFRVGMAKARESHCKDLEVPTAAGCAPPKKPPERPLLPLEPLPSAYYRYAVAFDFLLNRLNKLIGESTLRKIPAYRSSRSVAEELAGARELMVGFCLIGLAEIGLERPAADKFPSVDRDRAFAAAKQWLAEFPNDPRLALDTRIVVPVTVEVDDRAVPIFIHFWGTIGVRLLQAEADFRSLPQGADRGESMTYLLPADKFIAFKRPYARGPLTRDEYRGVLDRSGTVAQAVERLSA